MWNEKIDRTLGAFFAYKRSWTGSLLLLQGYLPACSGFQYQNSTILRLLNSWPLRKNGSKVLGIQEKYS